MRTSAAGSEAAKSSDIEWFRSLLVNAQLIDQEMLPAVVDGALLEDDLHLDSLAVLELHAVLAEHLDGWSLPRQLDPALMTVRDVLHYCQLAAETRAAEESRREFRHVHDH